MTRIMQSKTLEKLIGELGQKRPVFHSERDFQYALAWKIKETFNEAELRPEMPLRKKGDSIHLDLFIKYKGKKIGIELKYTTKKFEWVSEDSEFFSLSSHQAFYHREYDYIYDIFRLQNMIKDNVIDYGYAIFITNNEKFWSPPSKPSNTLDINFKIYEGRILEKELKWNGETNTTKGRGDINLEHYNYKLIWKPYSAPNNNDFKYLMVEINQ